MLLGLAALAPAVPERTGWAILLDLEERALSAPERAGCARALLGLKEPAIVAALSRPCGTAQPGLKTGTSTPVDAQNSAPPTTAWNPVHAVSKNDLRAGS